VGTDGRARGDHRVQNLPRVEITMRLSRITWVRVMLLGMALAMWPVGRWYVLRTIDGSDEPCGLLALVTLLFIAIRNGVRLPTDERQLIPSGVLLIVYVLAFPALSPLPRAIIAVAAFGVLFLRGQTAVAHWGLLALSLPVIATVQFYLGYPLRIVAAESSAILLRTLEFAVTRDGTTLHWRGETIMVDAPCSGVRMLWLGLYLAASIACWSRLGNVRSMFLFGTALVLVITANIVRATALFFKETGVVPLPEWTHAGLGLLVFAAAALLIMRIAAPRPEVHSSCA
jgi:exosortase/archaeosortase family protein